MEDLLHKIKTGTINQDNFDPEMLSKMPKDEMAKLIEMLDEGTKTSLNKVDNEGGMMIQPEP